MTNPSITSAANPRVQAALRLRNRGDRESRGLTLVDGVREIDRALAAGAEIVEAFVDHDAATADLAELVDRLGGSGADVVRVGERVLGRLSYGDRSEGAVAVARVPELGLDRLSLGAEPLLTVLENVEKPGNLGAVLRTVDGAGGDGLIAADPRTDIFNPNVIRASVGTVFSVPVASATSETTLAWLRAAGVRVVAARVDGSDDYAGVDLRGPVAIVLGSETDGLSEVWRGTDILGARLPMVGVGDSLNVSIAAAVLLYEARRQREVARRA